MSVLADRLVCFFIKFIYETSVFVLRYRMEVMLLSNMAFFETYGSPHFHLLFHYYVFLLGALDFPYFQTSCSRSVFLIFSLTDMPKLF